MITPEDRARLERLRETFIGRAIAAEENRLHTLRSNRPEDREDRAIFTSHRDDSFADADAIRRALAALDRQETP